MAGIQRRALLQASAAVAATSALARPAVAKGQTIKVWWNQGFYAAEDAAFRTLVAAWEKASGNTIELSLLPGQALNEKIVSALTSGEVPDLMYADNAPGQIIPQNAWKGKLLDLTDIVDTQRAELSPTAIQSSQFYDAVDKKRGYYGVPFKGASLNLPIWKSLIEKAGYKAGDIPETWDAFFDFFEPVQTKLRQQRMRHTYGLGYTLSTTGDDPNNLFNQFLLAYGGGGIVTPDGQLQVKDPKVRQAVITTLTRLTDPFKKGFVPPSALNWGDPDNNNAFHAKEVVMTPNDTISISVAVMEDKDLYYNQTMSAPLPLDNGGKQVAALLGVELAFIPKGAKNVDTAKDFLRYLVQPANLNSYLKEARGRWLPVMPSMVKSDPYWLDPKDPHRSVAVKQGVVDPTATWFYVFNPAYAQVNAEHTFAVAAADVINGMPVDKATDKAFSRIEAIFAQYQIPHAS
ncbi:MAG TPA: extracellular solute-binding protein [Rhodopila sp.]|uniref:ABC transporter substrate-binding protein n=1 Tax=Rhodopila sp. TaxID=2480087 RepID=UPI002C2A7451|nr:extracellular solute-binding protein [Rhodopila sp.]HVY17627.1 extracellular solute-binding protein [Rhodopila sp.]